MIDLTRRALALALVAVLMVGTCCSAAEQSQGLVLVTPVNDRESILLDAETGKEVYVWKNHFYNAGAARLLPDGSLLRVIEMTKESTFDKSGFQGGGIEIVERDGKPRFRLWTAGTFEMNVADALMLPNGNILAVMLEWKSREEAIRAGRDPQLVDEKGFLVPALTEFKVVGQSRASAVWHWTLWNHLYQNREESLPGYSAVPAAGCLNIATRPIRQGRRWLSPWGLSYNDEEDVIALTVNGFSEPWIIDHSTSTAEAATGAGGKRGQGGRLLNNRENLFGGKDEAGQELQVLSAQWSHAREGEPLSLSTVAYSKTGYRLMSLRLAASGPLEGGKPLFGWEREAFNEVVPASQILPTAMAPAENGKIVVFELMNGRVGMVDTKSRQQAWTYANKFGTRKFSPKGDGCCGAELATEDSKSVKEMAPLRSVFYYPAHYLQSPISK